MNDNLENNSNVTENTLTGILDEQGYSNGQNNNQNNNPNPVPNPVPNQAPVETQPPVNPQPVETTDDKQAKKEDNKKIKKIIKRIMGFIMVVIFVIWGLMLYHDYSNIQNKKEPDFCIFGSEVEQKELGTIKTYTCIGYKVVNYKTEDAIMTEFVPVWQPNKELSEINK
jgi:hypothetical protein